MLQYKIFYICSLMFLHEHLIFAQTSFSSEALIEANGMIIQVDGYSVPTMADWNNDGLQDLIIGEGSGTFPAHILIYLNRGGPGQAEFIDFNYMISAGDTLICPGSG
jgi:hypothetical protein